MTDARCACIAVLGGRPVAGRHGLDDGAVLDQRLGRPAGHEGQAELVVGGPVPQVGHEVVGDPVPGDAAQGAVELAVELRVGELVVLLDRLGHLGEQLAQVVPLALAGPLGRQPGDQPLQDGAGLRDLHGLRHADAAHRGAPVGLALDEPLGVELDERGPDRRAAHAVALGELELDQPLTGRERAFEDVVSQPVGDGCGDDHGLVSLSAEPGDGADRQQYCDTKVCDERGGAWQSA